MPERNRDPRREGADREADREDHRLRSRVTRPRGDREGVRLDDEDIREGGPADEVR